MSVGRKKGQLAAPKKRGLYRYDGIAESTTVSLAGLAIV
jgi:hypothetical protein